MWWDNHYEELDELLAAALDVRVEDVLVEMLPGDGGLRWSASTQAHRWDDGMRDELLLLVTRLESGVADFLNGWWAP